MGANTEDIERRIADIEAMLVKFAVGGVGDYVRRLRASAENADNFEDLLLEGQAALILAGNAFEVEMRDSPDLAVRCLGQGFFAEVKHFREKEQDRVDDVRLEEAGRAGHSIPYGNVAEGGVPPWQQVRDVLVRKARQYHEDAPFLVMIMSSSSHCVEEAEVLTAVHTIDDAVRLGDSDLSKLSGALFWGRSLNVGKWRRAFFYRTCHPLFPFTDVVADALDGVRG
jgi:hypothetical protein